MRVLLLLAAPWLLTPVATAHEVRPAYLQLHQVDAETYDVVWKVPGRGEMRLGLDVDLPAGAVNVTPPRGVFAGEAYTQRWRFTRAGLQIGPRRLKMVRTPSCLRTGATCFIAG